MLAQGEGGPKFRNLKGGEKLNQSLVDKHFVTIDQWGQTVHLIMRQRKGILRVWPCHG